MASLASTLRQNQGVLTQGPQGVLTEQTPEELQELARKAGMQAPPMTPAGAGAIGANPDQAKMAGTPQQKQAALNLSTTPDQSLQDTLRRQQVRTVANGSEKAEIQKSQDMQNMGTLGDRVTDFINAQRDKLSAQAGQGVAVQTASAFQTPAASAPQDLTSLQGLLGRLRQNPNDMNLMKQVNIALGYTNIDQQLDPSQINSLYESTTASLARGGGSAIQNTLQVSDLLKDPKFGYDASTLSNLLGIPQDQLQKMSIVDIQNNVKQQMADEFSKSQQLHQQATSGELGVAERGQAQAAGREASATGLRASEANMNSLQQQISNADQVQFDGQSYKVDDLLKSDTISGVITDYLNAAPGSPQRTTLDKDEPALSSFINKNLAVLQDAATKLQAGEQQFTDIQKYNKNLATQLTGGVPLDDKVLAAVLPNYKDLRTEKIDADSVPFFSYMQQLGPQGAQKAATEVSNVLNAHPEVANQFAKLTTDQMKKLDIADSGEYWSIYKNKLDNRSQIIQARTIQDLQNILYKGGSAAAAQNIQNQALQHQSAVLGFGGSGATDDIGTRNGQPISFDEMKARALNQYEIPPLANMTTGEFDVYKPVDPAAPPSLTPAQDSLMKKLGSAAASGHVSNGDIANANLNLDDLITLKGSNGKFDGSYVQDQWKTARANATNDQMRTALLAGGSTTDQINRLSAIPGDDNHIDKSAILNQIDSLAAQAAGDESARSAANEARRSQITRQQTQVKDILTGGVWAAIPPATQQALNNVANDLTAGQVDELKKTMDWSPNRTIPENLAIMARNISTLSGRMPQKALMDLRNNVESLGNGTAEGLKDMGGQVADYGKDLANKAAAPISNGGWHL